MAPLLIIVAVQLKIEMLYLKSTCLMCKMHQLEMAREHNGILLGNLQK